MSFKAFLFASIACVCFSDADAARTKRKSADIVRDEDTRAPNPQRVKLSPQTKGQKTSETKQKQSELKPERTYPHDIWFSIVDFTRPKKQRPIMHASQYAHDILNQGLIQSYEFFFGPRKKESGSSTYMSMNLSKLKLLWAWVSDDSVHMLPGSRTGCLKGNKLNSTAPQIFFTPQEVKEAAEAVLKSNTDDQTARLMASILSVTPENIQRVQKVVLALDNSPRNNELKYHFFRRAKKAISSGKKNAEEKIKQNIDAVIKQSRQFAETPSRSSNRRLEDSSGLHFSRRVRDFVSNLDKGGSSADPVESVKELKNSISFIAQATQVFQRALKTLANSVNDLEDERFDLQSKIGEYQSLQQTLDSVYLKILGEVLSDATSLELVPRRRRLLVLEMSTLRYQYLKSNYQLDVRYGKVSPLAKQAIESLSNLLKEKKLPTNIVARAELLLKKFSHKVQKDVALDGLVPWGRSSLAVSNNREVTVSYLSFIIKTLSKAKYHPEKKHLKNAFQIFSNLLIDIAKRIPNERGFAVLTQCISEIEKVNKLGMWNAKLPSLSNEQKGLFQKFARTVSWFFVESSSFLKKLPIIRLKGELLHLKLLFPRLVTSFSAAHDIQFPLGRTRRGSVRAYELTDEGSVISDDQDLVYQIEKLGDSILSDYANDRSIAAKARLMKVDYMDGLTYTLDEYAEIADDKSFPVKYRLRARLRGAAYFYHCRSRGKIHEEYKKDVPHYSELVERLIKSAKIHPKDRMLAKKLLKIMKARRHMTKKEAISLLGSMSQVKNTAVPLLPRERLHNIQGLAKGIEGLWYQQPFPCLPAFPPAKTS